MVYQRDIAAITNLAFVICSVGALMSVVFAVMGIKWWFRRRITFTSPDSERRERGTGSVDEGITSTDNHAEQLSLMNTGVYRRTADADGYAPIERPATLPPVKVKTEHNKQRRLPTLPRPKSSYDAPEVRLERFPEPHEIIPVAASRRNEVPPSTPATAHHEDLSKPVVVDIHIPDDDGVIRVENTLPIPEVRQRLQLKHGDNRRSYIEMDGGETQRRSNPYESVSEPRPIHDLNDEYAVEYNENYEPYTTVIRVGEEPLSRSSSLDTDAIEQDAQTSFGSSPTNHWIPNPIMKPRRSFLSDASSENSILNVVAASEDVNVSTVSTSDPNLTEVNLVPDEEKHELEHVSVGIEFQHSGDKFVRMSQANEKLDPDDDKPTEQDPEMDVTPLDASKIISPLPKRSKRGMVKNKRAPPPPIIFPKSDQTSEEAAPEKQENLEETIPSNIEPERNITRIYIGPNDGEDDPFTQTPIEVEPSHWVTFEKCKPVQSNDGGHGHVQHNVHHQLSDFNTAQGVKFNEDEIFAELGQKDTTSKGVNGFEEDDNWGEVDLQENKVENEKVPKVEAIQPNPRPSLDINQNRINRWPEIDEEKILADLGIDKNLVKVEPLARTRSQSVPAISIRDQQRLIKLEDRIPPTPPATSPPLFENGDDDPHNPPPKTRFAISIIRKGGAKQDRRAGILELIIEDDAIKSAVVRSDEAITEEDQIELEDEDDNNKQQDNEKDENFLQRPIPKIRTASIENLTNYSETSGSEPLPETLSETPKPIPTLPPRLKIYSNTAESTSTAETTDQPEIKSILKNKQKNVTFDQTTPTVIIPTLLSPDSSISPGLTPVTPMSDLNSPPLTPAPVLSGSTSPVLVPREYRRGLLDPIKETRRSDDDTSNDYDTDSLEGDSEKITKFNDRSDDDSDSDDDKVRTRMITGPKVVDQRQSHVLDELKEKQVKRDYVAQEPRTLRDMRKQQQEQGRRTDEIKFKDSLSEDESII